MELLCSDLTYAINDITARIMPAVLHQGLEELPDEILTDILVLDSSRNEKRYTCLNRVNKRFWSIVSSTPSCSSHMFTHKRDISEMRTFPVVRKVSLPVDCFLGSATPPSTFLHLMDRIRNFRWLSDDPHEYDKGKTFFEDERDLPSVKTLYIDNRDPESRFPCKWTFSRLTSLECATFLPSGPFPCLRHCVLNLEMEYERDPEYIHLYNKWETNSDSDYKTIYEFLGSTPSLETLSFPKNGNTPLGKDDDKPEYIELPKLRKLSLRCSPGADSFLELLRCPRLETLEIDLEAFIPDHFFSDLFDNMSKWRYNAGTVTNLIITGGIKTLRIQPDLVVEKTLRICLTDLHITFPHLKRLSIDGNFRVDVKDLRIDDRKDPMALTSVYFRIPLEERWDKLVKVFEYYKKKKAFLTHVEVMDRKRDHLRRDHTALKNLSTLFPNINIRVDEFKRIL